MAKTPEISIIVPIYNVEKFLRECLDSIVAQTYKDWECILVDDGSHDASGEICDEYAARDSRFRVVHMENSGVSAARNAGLELSRGRYIGWVDPDDIAHPEMIKRLRELIITYDTDVAEVSFESLFTSFAKDKPLVESIMVLDRGQVALEVMYSRKVPSYMWNKLFRREVIDAPFPEGMVFEDMYVMSKWVKNIRSMVISPEILYTYRIRSGSIVNSNYANNRLEYLQSVFKLADSLHAIEPDTVTEQIVNKCRWVGLVMAGKSIARRVNDKKVREKALMRIHKLSKSMPLPSMSTLGLKMWWRANLLRANPARFSKEVRFVEFFEVKKRRRSRKLF